MKINKKSRVTTLFTDEIIKEVIKCKYIKFKDTEAFDNFIKEIEEIKGSPIIDTSKIGIDFAAPNSDALAYMIASGVNPIISNKVSKVIHAIT